MAPDLSPDAWAQIRYAYEHTDTPVEDICIAHGTTSTTLRDRMRRWNWTRRRLPIPLEGPPPVAMAPQAVFSPPPVRTANGGEGSGVGSHYASAEPSPATEHGIETPAAWPLGPRLSRKTRFALLRGDERGGERPAGEPPSPPQSEDAAAIVPRLQGAVARVLPAIEATIARLAAGPHHPREMEQAGRALSALTRTLRELNALLSQHHAQAGAAHDDDMPEDIDAFRINLARRIDAFVASHSQDENEAPPDALSDGAS